MNALLGNMETADERTLSLNAKDLLDILDSVNVAGDKADQIAPLFKNQASPSGISARTLKECYSSNTRTSSSGEDWRTKEARVLRSP